MERSFSIATAAIKMSDKGRMTPFFFSNMEISAALCQMFFVISTYGRLAMMLKILFFSPSDFIPWRTSNLTTPHVQTAFSMSSISRWSAIFDFLLKNSIQMVVSTSILLFKGLFSLLLSLQFKLFFLFPIIIDPNLPFESNQLLDLFLFDKSLHGGCNRLCFWFFAGNSLNLCKEIIRYV